MKKVKITILKATLDKELAARLLPHTTENSARSKSARQLGFIR